MELSKIINLEALAIVLALSFVVMTLIEAFIKPAFVKGKVDTWWLLYVGLLLGGLAGWASGVNVFTLFEGPKEWIGRLLTSIICGGGPSVIYNLLDKGQAARLPVKLG